MLAVGPLRCDYGDAIRFCVSVVAHLRRVLLRLSHYDFMDRLPSSASPVKAGRWSTLATQRLPTNRRPRRIQGHPHL